MVSLLVTVAVGAAQSQDPFRLESLTVPTRLLPTGCRLVPDQAQGDRTFVMYPSLRQNPWVGSGMSAALIRRVVDGRLGSDGLKGPVGLTMLERGISGAYRARYVASDRSVIDVYAVHFNEPALTAPAALARLGNRPGRTIVIGSTAVWVSSRTEGDCFRAVGDYIGSLRYVVH
jgi:hypothetical protein